MSAYPWYGARCHICGTALPDAPTTLTTIHLVCHPCWERLWAAAATPLAEKES